LTRRAPDPSEAFAPRAPDAAATLFTALLTMAPEQLRRVLSDEPQRAAPWVRAAAEMGLAEGQLRYGRMLLEGLGVAEDKTAALGWFARAAQAGDVEAWNMLGRCYENGWGAPEDFAAAAHWFAKAAEPGDAWAQYNLGHLHLNGKGLPRDAEAAFACYRAASAQGHARAMNLMGRCCEHGWGVAADPGAAAHWYRLSAEGGYFRGQYNHAAVLMSRGDAASAIAWFQRAIAGAPPATRDVMVKACAEAWGVDLTPQRD
jgi:TPR repeat protein